LGTYWIIALVGALILLFTQLPFDFFWQELTKNTAVNPLKILILFFSMTFLSVYLDEVGLFKYLAGLSALKAKGSALKLFVITYFLTALLTVVTSNDVVILTFTPFICTFCKNTDTDPVPFLVGEFAAANTWSMALVIGNPTNVYLATYAGFGFLEYFKIMALPTVSAGIIEFALILLIFYKKLNRPFSSSVNIEKPKDKLYLIMGLVALSSCLVTLVISDYIKVQTWLVSVCFAAALLVATLISKIFKKGEPIIIPSAKRLPWQLIPFVLSMFTIVICMQYKGFSDKLGAFLGDKYPIWTYGASSFLAANVINNIPMSILFGSLPVSLSALPYKQAIFASIIGSNVGAFLTPIGALAGIMFTSLTQKYNVDYSFKTFIKYGLIGIPTIAVALGVLSLILK